MQSVWCLVQSVWCSRCGVVGVVCGGVGVVWGAVRVVQSVWCLVEFVFVDEGEVHSSSAQRNVASLTPAEWGAHLQKPQITLALNLILSLNVGMEVYE